MLNIRIQKLGDATVLHCVGRIAFPHAAALRAIALPEPHPRRLVLDLADVTSMDAAGLGVLISLRSAATQRGGTFKLMNVNYRVRSLLQLTGLKSVFEICSAREMLDLLCRAFRIPYRVSAYPCHSPIEAGAWANLFGL